MDTLLYILWMIPFAFESKQMVIINLLLKIKVSDEFFSGNITALDALKKGLDDLSEITVRVMTDFKANLDNTKSYTVEHSAQW